jgi:hypothetical protein
MDNNELQKIVEETRELARDNNKILHSIQRRDRLALIMKAVYWLVIIFITIGAFYYVQPYVDQLLKAYNGIIDTQHKMAETTKGFNMDTLKGYFK